VIIAQDTEEAGCMLSNLVEGYVKWQIYINLGKSECLILDFVGGTENNWS
jgi:hypothetical protein